ncbi:ABC transporter ATP-binding protein [Alkalicoccus halolimnae]|uniref:ABC transporter ATP-binding protein n=1 Tax=Alkalicoccus halolimnae TaxID=1667239 RepID=A0A5C7FCV9_9BACI|nr:ABC transporter ATP-binding protein [Alkalicoccus halolimnae]TXF85187.1 ABC transporter ATP-binding protein [Alkalicoccus halolimnae]
MTLELTNLTKTFDETKAVSGIDLKIDRGQMFGMLGANGAGKTTTFRMIIGLLDPTSGTAEWSGSRIDYSRTHLIGYLPEERGLFPKLTVKEQLIYLMRLNRMKKQDIITEMRKWLERFQVENYENKKVEELSKGNQQKIQFMAAVLHKPELLILDEPFSGLDPVNSDMLKEAVLDLQNEGTTIVFSSHQMRNVEELCDELIILKNGSAVLQGNLSEIKKSYNMKSIKIKADFDVDFLRDLPGVTDIAITKVETELKVDNEKTAESVFRSLAARGFVRKFEVAEPSLHDIFIDQAGGGEHE